MKDTKRAMRRHHYARKKEKYRKTRINWIDHNARNRWYYNPESRYVIDEEWCALEGARMATTHTPCSCYMCGNPRRHETRKKDRLTRQEQVHLLDSDEQFREYRYSLHDKGD